MRTYNLFVKTVSTLLLLILFALLSGCMITDLKKDVDKLENIQEIFGVVDMPDKVPGQLLAVAFTAKENNEEAVNYRVVDPLLKQFALMLDPGIYRFALVHDLNKNLIAEKGEPVYLHNRGHRVKFSEVVHRVNLVELKLPARRSPSSKLSA